VFVRRKVILEIFFLLITFKQEVITREKNVVYYKYTKQREIMNPSSNVTDIQSKVSFFLFIGMNMVKEIIGANSSSIYINYIIHILIF